MRKQSALLSILALGACATETAPWGPSSDDPQAIIGGYEATPNSQPWLVALRWDGAIQCGGVLLSKRWVLTAAHCFSRVSYRDVTAVIGEHDVRERESFEQRRALREPKLHPGFDPLDVNSHDDIALVELRSPIEINERAQTVALPTSFVDVYDVAGWGLVSISPASRAATLQTASVVQLPNDSCWDSSVGDNEFCAGGGASPVPIDTCRGDSGGPALNPTFGQRQETVGVVSRGDLVCSGLGVYTRVDRYLDWIRQTIGEPLVGQARMTWSGEPSPGFMELSCERTGETVRGPLDVGGVELSLDCPNSTVTGRCQVEAGQHRIADLYYGVDGSLWAADGSETSRSGSAYFPAGATGSFACRVE